MTDAPQIDAGLWFKSSRSCADGNCVETARLVDGMAVRDSKNPNGPTLFFGTAVWQEFVDSVRAGSFDLPNS
jgi:hypothetical protein